MKIPFYISTTAMLLTPYSRSTQLSPSSSVLAFSPSSIIHKNNDLSRPATAASFFRTRPRSYTTGLQIASMDRKTSDSHSQSKIDDELSSTNSLVSDADLAAELHSIVDDGHGHINSDLARSIWQWENERFHSNSDDPYPAKRLKYSTRDGLRLVDSIARKVNSHGGGGNRHSDLVQEGVVALMRCTVLWDEEQFASKMHQKEGEETSSSRRESFEDFARKSIEKAMKKLLDETTDNIEDRMEVNLDLLKKRSMDQGRRLEKQSFTKDLYAQSQLIQPLNEALDDANPTPDEIALSDMIRHDISEFLVRHLSDVELKVIRLKFGLEKNLGNSLTTEEIASTLGIDCAQVQQIEEDALEKLKASFDDDYIGAYIDDDHANEVSL